MSNNHVSNKPIKTAMVDSGSGELIAGVASRRLRIVGYSLRPDANGSIQLSDGASVSTGAMTANAGADFSAFFLPGLFELGEGLGLDVTLATATAVRGFIKYQEV